MFVVGDLGGTHCRFALSDERGEITSFEILPSLNYPNFIAILSDYLRKHNVTSLKKGCFAVAGPVINGVCKVTNLPWIIDAQEIAKAFSISEVYLLNDLEANAYAVDILPREKLEVIHQGMDNIKGNKVVISPGTGLGEACLYWDGTRHHPFACEGGHADFAPLNELQLELSRFLIKNFEHPAFENVLSGPGLHTVFRFLTEVKGREVPPSLKSEMMKNPGATITRHALSKTSPVCEEAVHLFITVLGQECSNAALKFMALGGIYLGGGIIPQIISLVKSSTFTEAFFNKGRWRYLLEKIAIYAILDDKAALYGTLHCLMTKKL